MKFIYENNEDGKLPETEVEQGDSDMSIEAQIDLLADIILSQILKEL